MKYRGWKITFLAARPDHHPWRASATHSREIVGGRSLVDVRQRIDRQEDGDDNKRSDGAGEDARRDG